MNDLMTLLYYLNRAEAGSQRDMAQATNLSLGKINLILKRLEEQGYIEIERQGTRNHYKVTEKGLALLETGLKDASARKIQLAQAKEQIHQAVILAAGQPRNMDQPVPLLSLGDHTLLDRTLQVLRDQGVERFVLVAGFQADLLAQHVADMPDVTLVVNEAYAHTGTMASLATAAPHIDGDFFLIEGDLLFEIRGIKGLNKVASDSAMLITSVREQHDEAMVELRDGYVYKMGKDIHQFNRIDGEMIGLSKLSYPFYLKMLAIYADNLNPYVNYEYIMLDVAQDYRLGYLKLDDFFWGEIDDASQVHHVLKRVYPRLVRKEEEAAKQEVQQFLADHMDASPEDIATLESAGGMTNKNYKVTLKGQPYIIRIAGNGTEKFINRSAEKSNSLLAHILGLDAETLYFDEVTGTKVSAFIPDAETLNANTATYLNNMRMTTGLLRQLHQSGLDFDNRFDVFEEIVKYESFVDEVGADYFDGYQATRQEVFQLQEDLADLPVQIVPCHIDTVPENFVKGGDGKSYLIDWEYSGMNDLAWDLAAHSLECGFSQEQEDRFLSLYCQDQAVPDSLKTKLLIYQICQDFLWSVWTIFKESRGDDFGDYGIERYRRAQANLARYHALKKKGRI